MQYIVHRHFICLFEVLIEIPDVPQEDNLVQNFLYY